MWRNLSVLCVINCNGKTIEQGAVIRFCWKAGFNATKTFEMVRKVNGESAVHRATVFHWYNAFSEGRESIYDGQRSRRPMTIRMRENIARIADILKEDRRSFYRLITKWTRIPKTIVQKILCEDLQKWKLCFGLCHMHWQPNKKNQRLNHAYDLIETIKRDPNFLHSIITGDESWCFTYDQEAEHQSSKWCSLHTLPSKKFLF